MTTTRTHVAAALSVAAIALLVPANVLPVMHVNQVGEPVRDATILGGVRLLADANLWGLAIIVFTASVAVPALKLGGMAFLLWGARHPRSSRQARRLTRLYTTLEHIGRWSMLDVFIVAFLAGAVRFGRLATIEPRPGIIAFAAVVVLTMLATHAFDPRMLWRGIEQAQPTRSDNHG
jgi:paraquat-inducible protein A